MGSPTTPPSRDTVWSWFKSLTDPNTPREQFYRGLVLILIAGVALWPVLLLLLNWVRGGLQWWKS